MTISPKYVLVADNDQNMLDSVEWNLKMAGYTVITANSPETAKDVLEQHIIHLAIIDMRLKNNKQIEFTGFDVAKKVPKYVPIIIYTAFEEPDTIKQALAEVGAKASIDKRKVGAATELIDTVDKLFTSEVKVKFDLQIEGVITCGDIATQIEIPSVMSPQPSTDDVCQILQSLFYDADSIYVAPLFPREKASTLSQSGSVLLCVRPRYKTVWAENRVLKLNSKIEAMQEVKNYDTIKKYLGGRRQSVLDRQAYSRQIGGVTYSLIDAEDWETIQLFSDFCRDTDTDRVIVLLERFFSQTFGTLFAGSIQQPINITENYVNSLNITRQKLMNAVKEFHPEALSDMYLHFKGIQGAFINPILWSLDNEKFRRFDRLSKVCLCHGDLHGRNILVDSNGGFWLIDFARVIEGHAIRDFVELETDIKFNILQEVDLKALLHFERCLFSQRKFKESIPQVLFERSELIHFSKVIFSLRDIAANLIALEGDMQEYYQALLFNTLNILRLKHVNPAKKEHALLSASLICQRLEDWPKWNFSVADTYTVTPPNVQIPTQNKADEDDELAKGQGTIWQGWQRLVSAVVFLALATGVLGLLWWFMQLFNVSWQQHLASFFYIAVFTITIFALLGLVKGLDALNALSKLFSFVFSNRKATNNHDKTTSNGVIVHKRSKRG